MYLCPYSVPESAIFGYRRVPRHVPQYPWHCMRALAFAWATSFFRGEKVSRARRSCSGWSGSGSWWNWKRSKSLSTSVTVMYESSPENSPDPRSVCSCSSGSNTDESPVTERESFRRVRRGPKLCSWEETQAHSPHCFFVFFSKPPHLQIRLSRQCHSSFSSKPRNSTHLQRERERERERERDWEREMEWVRERERETRNTDKTGVCLIALNTSKRFTASAWASWCQAISNRRGKDAHTKLVQAWLRLDLRVRTRRELLPITSKTLKTTRWIFVIDHSKQSLCNEQDTRHSHFLSTARMRLSTPLEGLRWRCHGVATSHVSLSMWHVTIPKYRTFLDWYYSHVFHTFNKHVG